MQSTGSAQPPLSMQSTVAWLIERTSHNGKAVGRGVGDGTGTDVSTPCPPPMPHSSEHFASHSTTE